ncbi:hypothetical protein [Streptosporangium amethystogenes]|uniref:hypothetical protein n=1 Tax=Streptosporangium amethystogenes TaxID=2002 RepID=UPI0004C93655|nr:hypothetical protein [Streptosporangium amethystogenes]
MSPLTTRLSAAALAVALCGTFLVQSPASAAGSALPAVAPAAAPNDFRYLISFPKHVRRGGSLIYTVKVRNVKAKDQHYVALVGDFPTRFRKIKVISKPRSVKCSVKRRDLSCWITSLDKGDSTTVRVRAWAGSRRGIATVKFGAIVTTDGKADVRKLRKEIRRTIKARTRIR